MFTATSVWSVVRTLNWQGPSLRFPYSSVWGDSELVDWGWVCLSINNGNEKPHGWDSPLHSWIYLISESVKGENEISVILKTDSLRRLTHSSQHSLARRSRDKFLQRRPVKSKEKLMSRSLASHQNICWNLVEGDVAKESSHYVFELAVLKFPEEWEINEKVIESMRLRGLYRNTSSTTSELLGTLWIPQLSTPLELQANEVCDLISRPKQFRTLTEN